MSNTAAIRLNDDIHKNFINACYTSDVTEIEDYFKILKRTSPEDYYKIIKYIEKAFYERCERRKIFNEDTGYKYTKLFINKNCGNRNCIIAFKISSRDKPLYCSHINEIAYGSEKYSEK